MMRGYVVYRVVNAKGGKEAIGSLLERRSSERGISLLKLLAEAEKIFGDHDPVGSSDAMAIVLAPPSNAEFADWMAIGGGIVTIVSRRSGPGEEHA
jgi:hypothetical protein